MTVKKALVVEDSKVHQFIQKKLLESLDFSVEIVDNGQAALQRTSEEDYDVMLLDLGLPGISGEFVLNAIRIRELSTQKHLPIIVNTAHGGKAKLKKCRESGADATFQKPLSLVLLKQTLEEIMQSR